MTHRPVTARSRWRSSSRVRACGPRWRPATGRPARRDGRAAAGPQDGRVRRDRSGDRRTGARGGAGMRIAVIGLGHIGLPLAVQYASRGHDVTGVDIDERIVDDPQPWRVAPRRRARRSSSASRGSSRAGTCEPRPGRIRRAFAGGGGRRDRAGRRRRAARDRFRPIDAATRDLAANVAKDALVVYETTLPVGTTRDRFDRSCRRQRARARSGPLPRLQPGARARRPRPARPPALPEDRRRHERGERVARSSSIGPSSTRGPRSGRWPMPRPPRWSKLAETTYRDVNIAYANELARFAARRGLDVTEVIGAANSQPYSHIHQRASASAPMHPGLPPLPLQRRAGPAAAAAGARDQRVHGPLRGRHDRGPHRLARRPAGARARHRLPRRRQRGRLQLRLPAARRAARGRGAIYGHDPYFAAEHLRELDFEPYELDRRSRARGDPPGRARGVPVARPAGLPGLELFVDGRNALERDPFDRAGVRYVGSAADVAAELPSVGLAAGRGVWVVLPTYNERENVERIANAILGQPARGVAPHRRRLVAGWNRELADTIAARGRVSVLHRPAKQGLGVAYRDGFRWVLERPDARAVVQMDADFSHDPADLPRLCSPRSWAMPTSCSARACGAAPRSAGRGIGA